MPYKCETWKCEKQCENKEINCKCSCCRKKCLQPDSCKPLPPSSPQSSAAPSGDHLQATSQALSSDLGTEAHSIKGLNEQEFEPFRPNPQVIAAVIVAIIVAIILLDLCIFRFPVGRNIRDFLVRKIPFCIAFYS